MFINNIFFYVYNYYYRIKFESMYWKVSGSVRLLIGWFYCKDVGRIGYFVWVNYD